MEGFSLLDLVAAPLQGVSLMVAWRVAETSRVSSPFV